MWDSAMAENGILKVGRLTDFQAHQIEHQLGAYTDCNHGQGLAVIQPVYYRHIVKDGEEKVYSRFAKGGLWRGYSRRRAGSSESLYQGMWFADKAAGTEIKGGNHAGVAPAGGRFDQYYFV